MPTITTRDELLARIDVERRRLEKNLALLNDDEMTQPGVNGDWSVKDVVAHLIDWEQRFLGWYQAGTRGQVPRTPAPGLNWGQLHILNQQVYEANKDRALADIQSEFTRSYQQVLQTVQAMTADELFSSDVYAWTKNELLVSYVTANTANHYRWAKTLIRNWMRAQGKIK